MCLIHQTRQQVTARTSRTPPSRSTCVAADSVAPVVKTSSTRMTRCSILPARNVAESSSPVAPKSPSCFVLSSVASENDPLRFARRSPRPSLRWSWAPLRLASACMSGSPVRCATICATCSIWSNPRRRNASGDAGTYVSASAHCDQSRGEGGEISRLRSASLEVTAEGPVLPQMTAGGLGMSAPISRPHETDVPVQCVSSRPRIAAHSNDAMTPSSRKSSPSL